MAASLVNWGFGLVVGAILVREVPCQVRVDFDWLVAAAYSGFAVWASGLSSSIAQTQATHGNALNIIEKITGRMLPLSDTVFATFNWLPTLLVVLVMPSWAPCRAPVWPTRFRMLPFQAVPVVAMAGIGIQRVMGYTVVTFVTADVIYALAPLPLV